MASAGPREPDTGGRSESPDNSSVPHLTVSASLWCRLPPPPVGTSHRSPGGEEWPAGSRPGSSTVTRMGGPAWRCWPCGYLGGSRAHSSEHGCPKPALRSRAEPEEGLRRPGRHEPRKIRGALLWQPSLAILKKTRKGRSGGGRGGTLTSGSCHLPRRHGLGRG